VADFWTLSADCRVIRATDETWDDTSQTEKPSRYQLHRCCYSLYVHPRLWVLVVAGSSCSIFQLQAQPSEISVYLRWVFRRRFPCWCSGGCYSRRWLQPGSGPRPCDGESVCFFAISWTVGTMGNTQNSGLENNFCREITKEEMMMLRIELTTASPARALKQLGLEAFHMPYYVEQFENDQGQRWKSYHDLVGEIDTSIPATMAWKYVPFHPCSFECWPDRSLSCDFRLMPVELISSNRTLMIPNLGIQQSTRSLMALA